MVGVQQDISSIDIPRYFKPVYEWANTGIAKEMIEKYNGRIALIKDSHLGEKNYGYGKLRFDKNDGDCYYVALPNSKDEKRLHFHDLEKLLVEERTGDK